MKEYLISAESVDPSLGRLQAARLANSVVAWLNVQARQIERLPMQAEDNSPGQALAYPEPTKKSALLGSDG